MLNFPLALLLLLLFIIFQFSLTAGYDAAAAAAAAAATAGGGGGRVVGEREGRTFIHSSPPSTLILMQMDPKAASFFLKR